MAINIERFISNACSNSCQSFYDIYVEANVRFRSKLGMKAVIIRRQLGHCCDWCASLAGIYDPSDAPDDIYRRHSNCRCLVTYKTQDGYQDVWNKKVYQTQRQSRIDKLQSYAYKINTSPIKVDESNYDIFPREGVKHSKETIEDLKKYARSKGFRPLDFETYDGDISGLKSFIDSVESELEKYHPVHKRVCIKISHLLDKHTYAQTINNTIEINSIAYRDLKILGEDYQSYVEKRWFTQNSTYKDIPIHESAHIITLQNSLRYSGLTGMVFEGITSNELVNVIKEHISEYASASNLELIAESYVAYLNGSRDQYVLKTLDLCGILKV